MHSKQTVASGLVGVALAMALLGTSFAQDAEAPSSGAAADDGASAVPALFIQVTAPADADLTVPPGTSTLTIQGLTLPGADLSVDGDVVAVDDQGNFAATVPLDEGANPIEVVASDTNGDVATSTVYVTRGDEALGVSS